VFHALSDETRLAIIERLKGGERCVCDLQDLLDAAQSRLSEAAESAEEAAQAAQNATLVLGFLTAAGFLVSLVAAWFGAVSGGSHRDSNTIGWVFVRARRV
jgi:DNA-binding transcriptional ArsR family regulator